MIVMCIICWCCDVFKLLNEYFCKSLALIKGVCYHYLFPSLWFCCTIVQYCSTRSSADTEIAQHAIGHWTRKLLLPKCKTPQFSILHWSSTVEFGITEYCNPGRLWYAYSQDIDISCAVPISTFCCIMWSQSTNVTDGRTSCWLAV